MDACADFTTVLRSFMARAARGNKDMARLTGISLNTLEGWTTGRVTRPRFVTDVLKLAQALGLDVADTTTLLTAARHPSLADLQAQARQTGDSALDALLRTWWAADVPARRDVVQVPPTLPRPAVRHQLRSPVADFVGRAEESAALVRTLQQAPASFGPITSAIQGMGGIGKTELAYAVALQLLDTFPDAQIVLNLRGTSGPPLTPEQALQAVIRAFNPNMQLPPDLQELELCYRALLHDQRVLILADDARDAAQVRSLIPPAHSALLVTSRQRFTLPGMQALQLERLAAHAGVSLLQRICSRLSSDDSCAIIQACDGLPLALRVSGSILANNPALQPATYLAQLADERQRLNALRDPDDPQLDVATSLALSYMRLDPQLQWVFRQLGVLVADFDISLAQSVLEAPEKADAVSALHTLLRRNLLIYDGTRARWQLHDLVRDVARHYLKAAGEWEAAWWRYSCAVVQIAQAVQQRYLAHEEEFTATLARFDDVRPHLDAARCWAAAHAGTTAADELLLGDALATHDLGNLRYHVRDAGIPQAERALMAARRLGRPDDEAQLLTRLGILYADLGELRQAIACYEQSLCIARAAQDSRREAKALNNMGLSYWYRGDVERAVAAYEQVLAIARAVGEPLGESIALNNLGLAASEVGDAQQAHVYHQRALDIAQAIDDRYGAGIILSEWGRSYMALGDAPAAIRTCRRAWQIIREVYDQREEGAILTTLGMAYAALGERAQALSMFDQALSVLRATGQRHGEAQCQWHYGLFLTALGEYERALPLLRLAVAYEQAIEHVKAAAHAALLAELEARAGLGAGSSTGSAIAAE